MKHTLARIAAALGLVALLGAAYAQTGKVPVHSYTRKTKTGKIVSVKGYKRTAGTHKPKMTAVKSYLRKTKSGKLIAVHGYARKAPAKKMKKM